MSEHCCRKGAAIGSMDGSMAQPTIKRAPHSAHGRHFRNLAGWLIPSATLVLLPKCPACIAAYIALGSGIGISLSTATHLRILLMTTCVIALAYVTSRQGRRLARIGRHLFGIYPSDVLDHSITR